MNNFTIQFQLTIRIDLKVMIFGIVIKQCFFCFRPCHRKAVAVPQEKEISLEVLVMLAGAGGFISACGANVLQYQHYRQKVFGKERLGQLGADHKGLVAAVSHVSPPVTGRRSVLS